MVTLQGLKRDLGGIAVVIGLMLLATYLPPDTSLKEVEGNGSIRVCVPTSYPPLVTGDPERPGIDIELLHAVAGQIGVSLLPSPSDAMGRDFNPRNWAINRAKCQLLAGGVVDSTLTRSFLDTGPAYATTGWAVVSPEPLQAIEGRTLGVLTLVSGLDRLALSGYLRAHEVTLRVMRNRQQLVEGIASGELDGGITEALLASGLATENGWWVAALPDELPRFNLVIGMWKGDLTLKRKVVAAFRQLEADGTLAAILDRYGVEPMPQLGAGEAM